MISGYFEYLLNNKILAFILYYRIKKVLS